MMQMICTGKLRNAFPDDSCSVGACKGNSMKSLAKNSIYNTVYQVLNLVFPLISSIYVARILSPEGVGRVAYAQNIASYFVTVAALGIPTVGIRVISAARDDSERLNREFSELFFLNVFLTTIALAAYILVVALVPEFRANISFYAVAGLSVAFNYFNIDWLFQGLEEYVYIVLRSLAIKVLSILALFLFVRTREDCLTYLLITCLATCGNYLLNVFQSRKMVSIQVHGLSFKKHLRPVMVLGIAIFLNAIYAKVDTTMLGIMAGEKNVGYYSYAHKVLQIAVSFCTAVTSAFLPRLIYYYEQDKQQFDALIKKGIQIVSFLAFPAAVGLFLLAPEAIEILFGADFLPAAQTLRCFSVMILLNAFGNLLCYQMVICSGNENKLIPILSLATCLNVFLNALLIPRLQENGAAIASVCTEMFIVGVESVCITRKLKIKCEWKAVFQGIFSSAIMGAFVLLFKKASTASILSFVCCIGGGVIVYALLNIALKNQFTLESIAAIRAKMHSLQSEKE